MGVDVSKLLVDNNTMNTLSLCHFALEANQRTINDLIVSTIIDSNVSSICWFMAHVAFDSVAIIYFITNLQICHRDIGIRLCDCGLRDKHITALADALAGEHRNLRVVEIDLSGNRLTDESLAVLFEKASPAFSQSLLSVNLRNNLIGPNAVNFLTSVLAKSVNFSIIKPSLYYLFYDNNDCSKLDISDNPLGVDGYKALRNALCANKLAYLEYLSLAGSLTSDAYTNAELILAFGSGHCCALVSLDLSRNNFGAPGGETLGKILSDLHLHTLILTETMLGDEGVTAFIQNLKDTVSHKLVELYLDNNGIQAAGISCLAESVCTGTISIYEHFSLANNLLGLEGVMHVVKILMSDDFWADHIYFRAKCIDLSGCQLTTAGGSATNPDLNALGVQQSICNQHPRATDSDFITVLATLMIDNNNFSGEGVRILATFLYTCQKNINQLFSRSCGISSNDLKQLLVLLSELKLILSHLFIWELSDNDIDDDGVSALIQHLPMFPQLKFTTLYGNIRISPGMVETFNEALKAREVLSKT